MEVLNLVTIFLVGVYAVVRFVVAVYSKIRNPHSSVVTMWFWLCLAVGVWSIDLFLLMKSSTEGEGILYSEILHAGAAFIPVFFLHFVGKFIIDATRKSLLLVGYVLALVFGYLSFTEYIVAGVSEKFGFAFWIDAGSLYPLFLAYFWIFVALAIWRLIVKYRVADGIMKRKIGFILAAGLIGFLGGGTNFLPQTLGIYPFGNLIAWLDPILVTYGIFLGDLKLKIRR